MTAPLQALPASLRDALAAGTVVLTPNKRLARRLTALYDAAQLASHRGSWSACAVLPWDAWLRALWQEAIVSSTAAPPSRLLPPAACAHLWRRIVAADRAPLIDDAGAAVLAHDAWTLLNAWGTGAPVWRAWRDDAATEDTAAFARWAEAYDAELRSRAAIDAALLPDALAALATTVPAWSGREVLLAGFIENAPQQGRLLDALQRAGMRVRHADTVQGRPKAISRVEPASPVDELDAALHWAGEQVRARPGARVGIVIEQLAARRDEVLARAYGALAPSLLLPGTATHAPGFNVSLGEPLARAPIVAAALALVALACGELPMGEAAALLRSCYLPGGAVDGERRRVQRAGVERHWLELGMKTVSLGDVLGALGGLDGDLAARWQHARQRVSMPSSATPRQWVDGWRAWLDQCGWPGDDALDSAAWQARRAWDDLLGAFAELASVESRITRASGWHALRHMAEQTLFQPEAADAPIEILGVLEAAGQPFDALWVAGLTAERWPAPASPHPLLPLQWQRERGAPRCSPARELAYAENVTELFARAAPVVVMSAPLHDGDLRLLPSALLLRYERAALPAVPLSHVRTIAACKELEIIDDDRAPALAPVQPARGGAYLVGQYADCPFQAFANARLDAQPWPEPLEGLSHLERGILVHAALAHFWRVTGDQAALVALDACALDARVQEAAQAARRELTQTRWAQVPGAIATGETARLVRSLHAWLGEERQRPPFAVQAVEHDVVLAIGGIALKMRVDRIDALGGGGVAIIDYKGGKAERPQVWFDAERPRAPQLGLYAMALQAALPPTGVRAVAYVQLRPDAVGAVGVAADAQAWPGLSTVGVSKEVQPFGEWNDVQAWWQAHLGELVARYAAGEAAVDPRNRQTCARCGREALCRVRRFSAAVDAEHGDA